MQVFYLQWSICSATTQLEDLNISFTSAYHSYSLRHTRERSIGFYEIFAIQSLV